MSSPVITTSPDAATTRSGIGGLCSLIFAPPKMRTVKQATMVNSSMARPLWLMESPDCEV
jgi:hypothetical protein